MSPRPDTFSDDRDEVAEIIASLPERWREPFSLRMFELKAFRAIGKDTGIRWGTIAHWAQAPEWKEAAKRVCKLLVRVRIDDWRTMQLLADRELMAVLDGKADPKDKLKAVEIVYDRTGLPAGKQLIDPEEAGNAAGPPPLHTPEGREAAVLELAALPPELLAEALRRQREAAPTHLLEAMPHAD